MDSQQQQPDERELEMIRTEMERTRASLSDKLGALESQVLGTVQSATDAVTDAKEVVTSVKETITDTASAVKESVSETISTIGDTFNIARHVENHPWAAMGCAVAAGFAGGMLLGSSRQEGAPYDTTRVTPPMPVPAPAASAREAETGGAVMDTLGAAWQRLTGGVQGLAVGSLMGLATELVRKALPESLHADLNQFIDDLGNQFGGKKTELSESVSSYVGEAIGPKEEAGQRQGESAASDGSKPPPRRAQPGNGSRRPARGR